MEAVAAAVPPMGSSSCVSAPSSPRPFGNPSACCRYYYTSAPTSPSRAAAAYADFYGWEEKPASPKPFGEDDTEASDFAFCFYGQSEGEWPRPSLATADELFEEGMIRPLMLLPPRDSLHYPSSAKSDKEGGGGRIEGGSNPTVMTMKEALRSDRGRAVSCTSDASSRSRRGSRSLSPSRGGEGGFPKSPSSSFALPKSSGSKKWTLKDLFLFRSASEGRATGRGSKDPLRRYTLLPPSSSSSSSSSSLFSKGIGDGGSVRRGSAKLSSAHEMYYSANRVASEELKKKTPLPYQRHSLFACLRFNPAIHSIKKGFSGSLFSRK